jgi:hypothetical protein
MSAHTATTPFSRRTVTLVRGTAAFAALGGVLLGVAGTVDWPVVGTFFAGLTGTLLGAAVGIVATPVLLVLGRFTGSVWAARAASGLMVAAAAVGTALVDAVPLDLSTPVYAALLGVGTVTGAALGPLVTRGAEPVSGQPADQWVSHTAGRLLAWGAALGVVGGAVTGLVIGMQTYLPTSPVAAVEGAVLGLVSGLVAGAAVVGVVVLPRLRPRR